MNKTFTPEKFESTLLALLFMVMIIFLISSCSTGVEREAKNTSKADEAIAKVEQPTVMVSSVASIEEPAEETYFDLIAKTSSSCLGEDLWIGGKVESANKLVKNRAEGSKLQKVYEVKELTATGLNSNTIYTLLNEEGTLQAVCDESGVLYIKLAEGPLQLVSSSDDSPVTVAYEPIFAINTSSEGGQWSCR